MGHFFAFLGKLLVDTIVVTYKTVGFLLRNLLWTLAVATIVTGWLAYRATEGRPWESGLFLYSAIALVGCLALKWGYRRLTKMAK